MLVVLIVVLLLLISLRIKRDKRVLVFVLGDIGRSPRMVNHALSLARCGLRVDFCGYVESSLPMTLEQQPLISIIKLSPSKKLPKCPKWLYVLLAASRVCFQILQIFLTLLWLPSPTYILTQTPPAIPTLFILQTLHFLRGSKLIIDWHNFGYSIMALNLGQSRVVQFAKALEKSFGHRAFLHLCVSKAMKTFLEKDWKVHGDVLTLYDKAPLHFRKCSESEKKNVRLHRTHFFSSCHGFELETKKFILRKPYPPDQKQSISMII